MLAFIAATLVTQGTCAQDAAMSSEEYGEVVTCYLAKLPTITRMLQERSSWTISLTNPKKCQQPINATWQVITGPEGVIERLAESKSIAAKIDRAARHITITCNY